jgi:hypothetical protein
MIRIEIFYYFTSQNPSFRRKPESSLGVSNIPIKSKPVIPVKAGIQPRRIQHPVYVFHADGYGVCPL